MIFKPLIIVGLTLGLLWGCQSMDKWKKVQSLAVVSASYDTIFNAKNEYDRDQVVDPLFADSQNQISPQKVPFLPLFLRDLIYEMKDHSIHVKTPESFSRMKDYTSVPALKDSRMMVPEPYRRLDLRQSKKVFKALSKQLGVDALMSVHVKFELLKEGRSLAFSAQDGIQRKKFQKYGWRRYIKQAGPSTILLNVHIVVLDKNGDLIMDTVEIASMNTAQFKIDDQEFEKFEKGTSKLHQALKKKWLSQFKKNYLVGEH